MSARGSNFGLTRSSRSKTPDPRQLLQARSPPNEASKAAVYVRNTSISLKNAVFGRARYG